MVYAFENEDRNIEEMVENITSTIAKSIDEIYARRSPIFATMSKEDMVIFDQLMIINLVTLIHQFVAQGMSRTDKKILKRLLLKQIKNL